MLVTKGLRTEIQTRQVGYWGPPRPDKVVYHPDRPNFVIKSHDPPEGTKDAWVILCDKPGAIGPITETRTVAYTEWEVRESDD